MWSYQLEKNGFRLICKNNHMCINFLMPYILEDENHIFYWNESKIIKLIDDLNKGKIPFNIDTNNLNQNYGIGFSFELSTNHYIKNKK